MKRITSFLFVLLALPLLGSAQLSREAVQAKLQLIFSDISVQQMLSNPVVPPGVQPFLALDRTQVVYQGSYERPTYLVPAIQNDRLVGVVDVARVDTRTTTTDNGSEYVVVWRDYRDLQTAQDDGLYSGTVRCFDLNKNGLHFGNALITNSKTTDFTFTTSYLRTNPNALYCDRTYGNGNGNLGYAECYRCLRTECANNSQCNFLMGFSQAIGTPRNNWVVNVSFGAACIILSIKY